jgi:arsenate reductase (thioredoxin)
MKALISIFVFLLSCIAKPCFGQQAYDGRVVLFVCEHGAARSVIAATYFNKLAAENKLNYIAVFRGTDPDDSLGQAARIGLTKDGFDVSGLRPQKVSGSDVAGADQIVTFGCEIPSSLNPKVDERWDQIPSVSQDYEIARDEILKKVNDLVLRLKLGQK